MKFGPGWRRKDGGGQPTRSPSTFPRTRTTLKRYIAYALFALAGFLLGWWSVRTTPADVTTSLLSPNEKMRAVLVEHPLSFIDRNFRVYLEKTENPGALSSELFRSPDEGRPIGSERFLWSGDNTRILLLGRHFFVKPEVQLRNGESLYLLYDVPSGRIWCNASQQDRYPHFGEEELSGYNFGGTAKIENEFREQRPAAGSAKGGSA